MKNKVQELNDKGVSLKIAAILFTEDAGSRLYTGLKKEAAERVGIGYELHEFSLKDGVEQIVETIHSLNQNGDITGIIIQKPTGACWRKFQISSSKSLTRGRPAFGWQTPNFQNWWRNLTNKIKLEKDVDGLHPENTKILPATVRAILTIIQYSLSNITLNNKKILILNRSDILGKPLYSELKNKNLDVRVWGSRELKAQNEKCKTFDIIISGTGRANLITGDMVKDGVVLIDVGEPQADIDFESVKEKASFITPVPGGVGPMTVASLLENCVDLVFNQL
ncbi:MAG: bifunctional 5,10-methylenetetrahydrofolate dehydrogenase/5,10-methenyltetrahydrofolate cyclohydrolase [Patescibacteria group bacterium]